jgi:mRNA interferase RelE/StbE
MSYRLLIEKRAIEELKSLPPEVQERIKKKIRSVLKEDPFPKGKGDIKKIQGSSFWRLRVGDYRVFYDVDREKNTVYILSIRHRSKAYREI